MRSPAAAWFSDVAFPLSAVNELSASDLHAGRLLLDADARLWPSGLPEAVCVVLARSVLEELVDAVDGVSPWAPMELCFLGRDLLSCGPHGVGIDTARVLLAAASLSTAHQSMQSARARTIAARAPGGPAWASAMLDRAEQVTLARDGWNRSDFESSVGELGIDLLRIPMGWFGEGQDRVDTCDTLGLFDSLSPVHAHACVSLAGEWDEWDLLGDFVRSAGLLVHR